MSFRRSGKASTLCLADCLLRRSYLSLPLFSIFLEIRRLQLDLECQVGHSLPELHWQPRSSWAPEVSAVPLKDTSLL